MYDLVISGDLLNKQTEMSLKRFRDIIAIEDSWRSEKSVFCDVFFHGLNALNNAGYEISDI